VARRPARVAASRGSKFSDPDQYAHAEELHRLGAGIRPGVPLDEQDPLNLVSIRQGFLESDADFGAVVVHGHTITEAPEVRPNRIDIDAGASRYGRLTCLVLEGDQYRFLFANRDREGAAVGL